MNFFSKKGRKRAHKAMVFVGIFVSVSMILLYSGLLK